MRFSSAHRQACDANRESDLTMPMIFVPEFCPKCGLELKPRFEDHSDSVPHPQFAMMWMFGAVFTIALFSLSIWATSVLIGDLAAQWGLRKREGGLLGFLAFAATLVVILPLLRWWWRLTYRLPRLFDFECDECEWEGTCNAYWFPNIPEPESDDAESDDRAPESDEDDSDDAEEPIRDDSSQRCENGQAPADNELTGVRPEFEMREPAKVPNPELRFDQATNRGVALERSWRNERRRLALVFAGVTILGTALICLLTRM